MAVGLHGIGHKFAIGALHSTDQSTLGQHTDEMSAILGRPAHVADRTRRLLGDRRSGGDGFFCDGLPLEGSSRLSDQQWCGGDSRQGNTS